MPPGGRRVVEILTGKVAVLVESEACPDAAVNVTTESGKRLKVTDCSPTLKTTVKACPINSATAAITSQSFKIRFVI